MKRYLFFVATSVFFVVCFNSQFASAQGNKSLSIEDFETGDFSQFEWQLSGNAQWAVTDVNPYEGTYCAKSGTITNSQSTSLSLDYNVYVTDTLSFWFKVSSETGYDYLRFKVDGAEYDSWSGEQPWQIAEFVINAGTHTFEWSYTKDGSVSLGQDAAWIDYITFPPEEIIADFTADTNVICTGDVVFFYDQSVGPITTWYWVFEGAIPSTSNEQNPIVGYLNPGTYGVYLEVSDGVESSNIFISDFMHVGQVPQTANPPQGISFLCASWGNSTYNTNAVTGVSSYNWMITPDSAGTISGNGSTNVTVVWEPDFLGVAQLQVAGVNYCGTGVFSDPLNITRYLPDVSVILPAYVALETPAFELTGGMPVGGTYSGAGVSNGMFDPMAAGLGAHVITYNYTDPNLCANSAVDTITVTQFTGIGDQTMQDHMLVYPNPSSGWVTLQFNPAISGDVNVRVFNALNKLVYEQDQVKADSDMKKMLNLSSLKDGLYYIHITGRNVDDVQKIILHQ